jgi:hypothetical protein
MMVRNRTYMKRKAQIVATLPDHVVEAILHHAKPMDLTKSEYLALIAKKWFADQCPPVTPEETAIRDLIKKTGANQPGTVQIRVVNKKS